MQLHVKSFSLLLLLLFIVNHFGKRHWHPWISLCLLFLLSTIPVYLLPLYNYTSAAFSLSLSFLFFFFSFKKRLSRNLCLSSSINYLYTSSTCVHDKRTESTKFIAMYKHLTKKREKKKNHSLFFFFFKFIRLFNWILHTQCHAHTCPRKDEQKK